VLDGHQRLSTLFGVLRLPEHFSRDAEEGWKWWLWYDLERRIFTQQRRGDVPAHWLALRSILRTVDFLAESRRIAASEMGGAPDLIEQAERVATRVKNFKLPILVVRGDLTKAVETFSRLNSTGRKMSQDQMLSALTYREGSAQFHLDRKIDNILSLLSKYHFSGVSRTIIYRAILAAMKMDVYRTDMTSLAQQLGGQLPDAVEQAQRSLLKAAHFLASDLGVCSYRLLPYEPQLMFLSEFFRQCPKPSETQRELLRRWFWVTSASGWFAGANDSQITTALMEMRDVAANSADAFESVPFDSPARAFPLKFTLRSARVRCFVLFALSLEPRSLETGNPIKAVDAIRADGATAFAYIDPTYTSQTANRIVVPASQRSDVRARLLSCSKNNIEVLLSHGITSEALGALIDNDIREFMRLRVAKLAELERQFLINRQVNVTSEESAESDIDTDEDDTGETG
jgi:hypothetical protein